jgi:hypothetical protein
MVARFLIVLLIGAVILAVMLLLPARLAAQPGPGPLDLPGPKVILVHPEVPRLPRAAEQRSVPNQLMPVDRIGATLYWWYMRNFASPNRERFMWY